MAERPTAPKVEEPNDWKEVPASDWQDVNSGATSEEPEGNFLQRGFDKLTTVTPEQEKGLDPVTKGLQRFGAGAIQGFGQPIMHPLDTLGAIGSTIAHPRDALSAAGKGLMEHPAQFAGNLVGGAVLGGVGGKLGGAGLKAIPTTAKAGEMFNNINSQLADVPVNLTNASAPLQRNRRAGQHPTNGRQQVAGSLAGNRAHDVP